MDDGAAYPPKWSESSQSRFYNMFRCFDLDHEIVNQLALYSTSYIYTCIVYIFFFLLKMRFWVRWREEYHLSGQQPQKKLVAPLPYY